MDLAPAALAARATRQGLLLAQGLARIMKPQSERERVSASAIEGLHPRHAVVLYGARLLSRNVRLVARFFRVKGRAGRTAVTA